MKTQSTEAPDCTSTQTAQSNLYSFPSKLSRARHEVRRQIAKYPALYLPLARSKHQPGHFYDPEVVSRETEIVIEAYPRSGNSFAVTAFKMAQQRPIRVAHHLHAAAQVRTGIQYNLPTLVTVRDPEEAVLSYVILSPFLLVRQALQSYLDFHEGILDLKDQMVVSTFQQVTTDFGQVIRRVNQRFGSSFAEFEHTEANVKRCFELQEEGWAAKGQREPNVGFPSEERKRIKDQLREQFYSESRGDRLIQMRTRAYELYDLFCQAAEQ
ncbi:hypothetical protein HNI00_12805 [Thermoleptolyngbya oregonensis NK1-22]|uniref:Sulfotransferase domain-containing protein n=1 Tax=Thermoleptolyngbya oregonensis NK1-22 TaxID=2547457 RepID=A0AA96YPD2_9CYAN|nr:hypothetical protein [Thermoleptolyngbya oregonensis]WOB43927.1 hypothetical protein HNI00_12805 [Thermoleptolyngbya oregonensis NK1-22]